MKNKLTLSIDKEVKDKAKKIMNISEEVENILKEKTLEIEKRTVVVTTVGKYCIDLIPRNWVVYEVSNNRKKNESYHPTFSQALIQLSKRLFEDSVEGACEYNIIDLKKLIELVDEHHDYIVKLTREL